jgi:hypothetical protein
MSSITNINNNAAVVNVGRTTPVSPGQQPANRSIPVVLASDQAPVPVIEQNKVQSEVALSLLGIPRAEVALGIFADVNTYDVNPSEWSLSPQYYLNGFGVRHLPQEAGALVEAGRNQNAILTSKRFFRYQPGRVSAATFGVKSSVSQYQFAKNPVVRKAGIFDNFDGYYWETRQSGEDDNFVVVRRTQSLLTAPVSPFGSAGDIIRGPAATLSDTISVTQLDDYRVIGTPPKAEPAEEFFIRDRQAIIENKISVINTALATVVANYGTDGNGDNFYQALSRELIGNTSQAEVIEEKCRRDLDFWIDFYLLDMKHDGNAHTKINQTNFEVGIFPDTATYELPVHQEVRAGLLAISSLSTEGATKIGDLVDLTVNFFNTATPTPSLASIDYGNKSILDTIYDTKKFYWAYIVSEYDETGTAVTYDVPTGFTEEGIKYKCIRDVAYIIDGYKNDIVGGGNAETVYNASMYYEGSGQSIYSQLSEVPEPDRHEFLRDLIIGDLTGVSTAFGGYSTGFGFSTTAAEVSKQLDLANLVIDNFSLESTRSMEKGERGFAGNLIVYRDGTLKVHAAVYDPNLLKPRKKIPADAYPLDGSLNAERFRLAEGEVTIGQHVKLFVYDPATEAYVDRGNLISGKVFKVASIHSPKGNLFRLVDEEGTLLTFTVADLANNEIVQFETVVPFIFPNDYDPVVYQATQGYLDQNYGSDPFPAGMMFPYKYAGSQDLTADETTTHFIGFVNTTYTDAQDIRTDIDVVNFVPEYINWVKNNVDPKFYSVYEYRVPRTRFSHDKLDGKTEENARYALYSDIATKPDGTVAFPGEVVREDAQIVRNDSAYNYDFQKVTMLKIEFSWYGAVGALFLAYVPVGNGEARWVRVHHLRASNQMKVPSLGNATLPITYNVYGGGDSLALGDGEESGGTSEIATGVPHGYGNDSHNIVKYGASYYIDGGDRGTVRLYSHNNDSPREAYGKQWTIDTDTWDVSDNSLTLDITDGPNLSAAPTFFMNSRIETGNRTDQNIVVEWADATKIYLSNAPNGWGVNAATATVRLIPDRANSVYGIETKRNIFSTLEGNPVRNRVQVYPTKLSTSNLGDNPVRLRLKKTPIFQEETISSGTIALSANYRITADNEPLPVTESATYLQNGESLYGWLKGRLNSADTGQNIVVFGRLYKEAGLYYFELLESISGTVFLLSGNNFLAEGRYDAIGQALTGPRATPFDKEGLSSVQIRDDAQVPIPRTGINIATLYLQEGTEQLDLLSYFDYNKEYLSYPLTDQTETLYLMVDSDTSANTSDPVSVGLTWEEQ